MTAAAGIAQMLKKAGRLDEAIDAWKEAVRQNPDNLFYQHDLAATLGDAGQNREAAKVAGRAIKKGLQRAETYLVQARALAGIGNLEDATAAYRAAILINADDAHAHRELAQLIWMRTGDRHQTEAVIAKAIEDQPENLSLKILQAEIRGQTGDKAGQLSLLQELIISCGRDPQICYFAARAAMANNAFDAALEFSHASAAAMPMMDDALTVYATALLAKGEPGDALQKLSLLRQRQPGNQYYIALEATAWRLIGDKRYHDVYDYDQFVFTAPLDTPKGWRSLDDYLGDLRSALNAAHCYKEHPFFLSVRHGSQISSITKSDNPAMAAFTQAISAPLHAFIDHLGVRNDQLRNRLRTSTSLVDAWSVLLPPGGYHVAHVHPEGAISSACHVTPPQKDKSNTRAGWLEFGKPGCATNPALPAEKHVEPVTGQVTFFPSYMWHGTVAFEQGPSRLSIAADFTPRPPW